jgi:hypothetical protein
MSYEMPKAGLGEWVFFQAHDNAPCVPAVITQVGNRTLTMWTINPGIGGVEKSSVHHKDDPGIEEFPEWKKTGVWQHQPKDPQVAILSEKVALLEKKLAAIAPKKG